MGCHTFPKRFMYADITSPNKGSRLIRLKIAVLVIKTDQNKAHIKPNCVGYDYGLNHSRKSQ